jgi:hypothetical protein
VSVRYRSAADDARRDADERRWVASHERARGGDHVPSQLFEAAAEGGEETAAHEEEGDPSDR